MMKLNVKLMGKGRDLMLVHRHVTGFSLEDFISVIVIT